MIAPIIPENTLQLAVLVNNIIAQLMVFYHQKCHGRNWITHGNVGYVPDIDVVMM